jgi:hypothetical protein
MKSIKEKAKEYGLLNPDIHYDADGNTCDDADKPSMDFEAGANYVLEEVEKLIFEKHVKGNLPLFDLTYLIDKLKEK